MKGKIIAIIILIILIFSTIFITFNKTSKNTITKTPYYSLDIDGDPVYLDENNAKVSNAKKVSEEFCKVRLNVDYNTFDYTKEYKYYINDLYENAMKNKQYEQLEKYYNLYKIVEHCDSTKVKRIKFYTKQGNEECRADLIYNYTLKNATQGFLNKYKYKLNTHYQNRISIYMKIENDIWKISNWEIGTKKELN
ncbi:hypothetical protein CLTEP_04440 [Clostridium tepidiprofundi DSM 19306]|uniref:Uncharacterized protein n=1 Tax=Clostridium tepidiprofundi DSM 19306 TaxID=1121338 RepID=A0A151B6E7_9CLOT|nr:hypothetical protein [Clostridium tepidiprofundi]KYH35505.1 hypothetical protein CLTEP_04440 [Clostridium tepidiprofundi DSM 19306]